MTNYDTPEVRKEIQKILVEEKPKTVRELVKKTMVTTGKEKEEIYQLVKKLENESVIKLGSQKVDRTLPSSISEYLFKIHYFSIEFWSIFLLTCIFFPVIILIEPESPFLFLRVIWGILFGLIIPGWTITNLIFPKVFELIDQFERALIAIGVNIGISIFTGLILNNVWIIDSIPFTITIGVLTFVILILSVILRILIGSNKIQLKIPKIKLFKKKK